MQVSNSIKAVFVLFLLLVLSACGNSGVEVSTKFSSAQDIKEGTAVYFEEKIVGEVTGVTHTNPGSHVVLEIDENAAKKISTDSAVVVNRIKPGAPLEIHVSGVASDVGLTAGQELDGLNSMFELVAWSIGDAFQAGSGEVSAYVDSFQNYLQGEQFQEDKAIVEEGVKEMAVAASEAIKSVEQELQAAMSDMSVTEEELAKAIEELSDEMSPLAKEMARSGTDLMQELDKFAQGLESASKEEQESGQKLIESLVAAIEKLNQSAEEGVNESLDQAE